MCVYIYIYIYIYIFISTSFNISNWENFKASITNITDINVYISYGILVFSFMQDFFLVTLQIDGNLYIGNELTVWCETGITWKALGNESAGLWGQWEGVRMRLRPWLFSLDSICRFWVSNNRILTLAS